MKMEELREMTDEELQTRLEELRIELFNLRFQKSKNLLDRQDRPGLVRRDIARILTLLKEREKNQ